jgi:hypothetical protein
VGGQHHIPAAKDRCNPHPHTDMLTGHGKTRSYLHRFKILEKADCPCGNGDQTLDHLLYQCTILNKQREIFKRNVIKSGKWPASKQEIISRQLKSFLLFLNSINLTYCNELQMSLLKVQVCNDVTMTTVKEIH